MIRLHAEGWSVSSIAEYLATSRQTVYATFAITIRRSISLTESDGITVTAPRCKYKN